MIGTFGSQSVRVPRARLAREDGGTARQVLPASKAMGGESAAAWTAFLEDMTQATA